MKAILAFFSAVVFVLVVMTAIVLALAGCHTPKPIQPAPPLPDLNVVTCRTPVTVFTSDACPDQFSPDYHPCAICHGGVACIAADIQVYCVTSTCAEALATGECSLVKAPPSRR